MKPDWIVIGNYGAANTGDEAMLAGLLDAVTAETPLSLCVVSKRGAAPEWAASSRAVWIPPQLTRVLPALWTARGLAMGGGTHFHDDYRTTRLVRHWWYLSRIVLVSAAAKAFGKRVVWLGVGVGPLDGAVTRAFARVALRLCDQVTVRDRCVAEAGSASRPRRGRDPELRSRGAVAASHPSGESRESPAPGSLADRHHAGPAMAPRCGSIDSGRASPKDCSSCWMRCPRWTCRC